MEIRELFKQLTAEQKAELRTILNLEFQSSLELKLNEVKSCAHCGHKHFRKCGRTRGVQRYKCKSCKRTFGASNGTPFYRSQKDLAVWKNYLDLMLDGFVSVRAIADKVGIHYRTAFYWRHKILYALKQVQEPKLNGIVEADETFFPLSYKGQKKDMPRASRKRGGGVKKRGISKEQACVLTATDRNANMLLQSACLGRISTKAVEDTLGPHIAPDSVLVTDKHSAYPGFARQRKLTHCALAHRTSRDSSIHLQNINSLHSQIKRFMRPFNGVATKYLDNYMNFYKWTKQDAADAITQRTACITCKALTEMRMQLK